jgi:hypothetical protein
VTAFGNFKWNIEEFKRIRTCEGMASQLEAIGEATTARSNEDLHAAQAARKQPVADGYDYTVVTTGDRARLFINATTARAMAHEAVNHTILKSLPVGKVPSPPPNHEVPRELARRSDEARNLDAQGQRIHGLDI